MVLATSSLEPSGRRWHRVNGISVIQRGVAAMIFAVENPLIKKAGVPPYVR